MKTVLGKADKYLLEQRLWDAHCRIGLARGIDLNKVSREWAVNLKQTFASQDARQAYEELCQRGCTPQVLAALFTLLRFSPRLERIWEEIIGSAKKRQKVSRALEKTASMLEDIFRDLIDTEDQKVWEVYTQLEHIPPSRLISELRFYRQFLNVTETLALDTETRSLNDFSKYLLASYVKRATGRYRRHRIEQAYVDKLDGKVREEFWEAKSSEWNQEEQQILMALEGLEQQSPERILDGVRILELANKAYILYLKQPAAEKAKLLRIVLSNCKVDAANVHPTYRKPFDLIFQRAKNEEWRA